MLKFGYVYYTDVVFCCIYSSIRLFKTFTLQLCMQIFSCLNQWSLQSLICNLHCFYWYIVISIFYF